MRCYYCNAPAVYRETFASRDRRRRVTPRRVCDQCFEATGGVRAYLIGKLYRETKKEQGGDRGNQYTVAGANNLPLPKTAERIAEQFNVSHQTVKNTEKFADAVDAIADTYGDEA